MTKGGKKRRGPSRSESQDNSGKYIPQFNKKHKCNNDSDENLERTQSNAELTAQPVEEEKTLKVGWRNYFLAREKYQDTRIIR